jgi:hypothetical protein
MRQTEDVLRVKQLERNLVCEVRLLFMYRMEISGVVSISQSILFPEKSECCASEAVRPIISHILQRSRARLGLNEHSIGGSFLT